MRCLVRYKVSIFAIRFTDRIDAFLYDETGWRTNIVVSSFDDQVVRWIQRLGRYLADLEQRNPELPSTLRVRRPIKARLDASLRKLGVLRRSWVAIQYRQTFEESMGDVNDRARAAIEGLGFKIRGETHGTWFGRHDALCSDNGWEVRVTPKQLARIQNVLQDLIGHPETIEVNNELLML